MSINNLNIFCNQGIGSIFNDYNINELDPSFNINDDSINSKNFLTSFDPNEFFNISNENSFNFNNNNNSGINIAKIINGEKTDSKVKKYFKARIEKNIPKPFLENEICKIFKKMKISKETKIKFISCINKISTKKEETKDKLLLNPRERRKRINARIKTNIKVKAKIKSGRKTKNDNSIRIHNKYSFDNMIDKIKNMINTSLVLFCNKIIKEIYKENSRIKQIFSDAKISKNVSKTKIIRDIDYNFIANKKKGNEILELLNMTFKEYLCNKISTKYVNIPPEYNEQIINQLLLDENNKNIFYFIFEQLKVGDWFNIFIHKKDLKDIYEYNLLNKKQKQIIKKNLVSIGDFLNKIYTKDETYFQCLVLLIYNFKRVLMNQERRIRN